MEKKIISIATLGPIGYLAAPGTMGTLVTIPLALLLNFYSLSVQCVIIGIIAITSFFIVKQALCHFTQSDPCQIIIDELLGCFITFLAVPFLSHVWIIGFVLFRFFDIVKPCGIQRIEKLPGAWGVLLDDVIAGLCAHLILRLFVI